MSVTTITEVGGHCITLTVNGARLVLDVKTAYEVAHQLSYQLEALAQDQVAKKQREIVDKGYTTCR